MDNILEFVKQRLSEDRSQWEKIAVDAGVPLATLIKVGKGHTKNPRVQTVMKLSRVLR